MNPLVTLVHRDLKDAPVADNKFALPTEAVAHPDELQLHLFADSIPSLRTAPYGTQWDVLGYWRGRSSCLAGD